MYKGISLDQAPPEDIPLRFFLTAPVFGILAGLLIVYEGNNIFISNWTQEAIALTHLFTLGWLAMIMIDRKSTRLNSSHTDISRMPSSA